MKKYGILHLLLASTLVLGGAIAGCSNGNEELKRLQAELADVKAKQTASPGGGGQTRGSAPTSAPTASAGESSFAPTGEISNSLGMTLIRPSALLPLASVS